MFKISAELIHILEKVRSIEHSAVISVQDMADSLLQVDLFNNRIRVIFCSGCIDHQLIKLGHFEEEDVKAEPFGDIYLFHFSIDLDLSAKIVVFPLFEGSVYQGFIQIEHECFESRIAGRWKQWLSF